MAAPLPPLLRLPPELRNPIYELAYNHDGPIELHWDLSRNVLFVAEHPDERASIGLSLLGRSLSATCKITHQESEAMFYPTNDFRVIIPDSGRNRSLDGDIALLAMRALVLAVGGLENAHAARSLCFEVIGRCSLMTSTSCAPVLSQLNIWCNRPDIDLRLQVVVGRDITNKIAMQDVRASCDEVLRELQEQAASSGRMTGWACRKLEEACNRAVLSRIHGRVVVRGEILPAADGVFDEVD
ncbi:hypothetical protein LTR17_002332 [Elasticomyces elasticus]|nr:hypothetical protein LTR17_002332 [Elasticomyces elasticus]